MADSAKSSNNAIRARFSMGGESTGDGDRAGGHGMNPPVELSMATQHGTGVPFAIRSPMRNEATHDGTQPELQRDPDEWKTGDEPMTAAQRSYLETLCRDTGEEFDDTLTKAEASKRSGAPRARSADAVPERVCRARSVCRSMRRATGRYGDRSLGRDSIGHADRSADLWDEPAGGAVNRGPGGTDRERAQPR